MSAIAMEDIFNRVFITLEAEIKSTIDLDVESTGFIASARCVKLFEKHLVSFDLLQKKVWDGFVNELGFVPQESEPPEWKKKCAETAGKLVNAVKAHLVESAKPKETIAPSPLVHFISVVKNNLLYAKVTDGTFVQDDCAPLTDTMLLDRTGQCDGFMNDVEVDPPLHLKTLAELQLEDFVNSDDPNHKCYGILIHPFANARSFKANDEDGKLFHLDKKSFCELITLLFYSQAMGGPFDPSRAESFNRYKEEFPVEFTEALDAAVTILDQNKSKYTGWNIGQISLDMLSILNPQQPLRSK